MNGPLRSTATDATTTIVAVIAILRASPYQNSGSGSIAPLSSLPGPARQSILAQEDGCPGQARA
jgi:hypothetical protein